MAVLRLMTKAVSRSLQVLAFTTTSFSPSVRTAVTAVITDDDVGELHVHDAQRTLTAHFK